MAFPTPTQQVSELADGGTVFAGTYHTRFKPDLTLTIDKVVDLDCSPGYHCRGDISANLPNWLDLEFGNVHGSELMVFRIDPVADPNAPNELLDPPADFAGWISTRPGIEVLEPRKSVTVGGIDATQIDLVSPVDTGFGPTGLAGPDEPAWFGLAANHETRAIVLQVDGQAVLITEQIGVENTIHDFEAAVRGLQPLLDSIVFE
jgi:hypothetical protein